MPIGPATYTDNDLQTRPYAQWTGNFTIGASDTLMSTIFNCGFCARVVAGAAGTIAIKRQGDTAFHPYVVVTGQVISGMIIAVGGTGSGSTAIAVDVEL